MIWSDGLRSTEQTYMERILPILSTLPWARAIVSRIESSGWIISENKPLLFEARYAYELHLAGISAVYEYSAGVGGSTVEFRIDTSPPWLVELVSVRATVAAKAAIRPEGNIYIQSLGPHAGGSRQTEEAEIITVEQKIGEKVFSRDRPTKFPPPTDGYHLILTDMRGYLDGVGEDEWDYLEIAYGAAGCPRIPEEFVHFSATLAGIREPVKGLFDPKNPLRASTVLRERIHFLGFVHERAFAEGEITERARYAHNPHLVLSSEQMTKAMASYPLKRSSSQS